MSLRVGLVLIRITQSESLNKMADVGKRVIEFGEEGVLIVLVGQMIACRDISTTDSNIT